jgi:hypothetical protein
LQLLHQSVVRELKEAIRRMRHRAGADAGGTGRDYNIDGSEPQVILTSSGQKLPFQEASTLCKVDSSFVKITLKRRGCVGEQNDQYQS